MTQAQLKWCYKCEYFMLLTGNVSGKEVLGHCCMKGEDWRLRKMKTLFFVPEKDSSVVVVMKRARPNGHVRFENGVRIYSEKTHTHKEMPFSKTPKFFPPEECPFRLEQLVNIV